MSQPDMLLEQLKKKKFCPLIKLFNLFVTEKEITIHLLQTFLPDFYPEIRLP